MQRGNIGAEIFAQDEPRPAQRIVPGVSFCWWHAIVLPTAVRNRSSSSDRMGQAYGVWSCCCMCGRLAPEQLMHRNWCGIFAHTASMESRVGWSLFKCGRFHCEGILRRKVYGALRRVSLFTMQMQTALHGGPVPLKVCQKVNELLPFAGIDLCCSEGVCVRIR